MDSINRLRERHPVNFSTLVALVRNAGTDNLSHFGNGYVAEGGYSLQQNPDEFAALVVHLSAFNPRIFLEIGSASGGTARFLHEHLVFRRMLSIDDGTHHRYPEFAANTKGLPLTHFKGDSHSPAAQAWLADAVGRGSRLVDVAFIDGDHSAAGVWQDVELVRPYMRPDARYIFHDTVACEGVKRAWERGSAEGLWTPLAEYVGAERPLGIGVGLSL